ncbi:hypothetical protein RYX36_005610, partial [Vicia faba]
SFFYSHSPFLADMQLIIPLYLYPLLQTTNKLPQFEYLRLASLVVIGAFVKVSIKEVIIFLLSSEIILLYLYNIDIRKKVSKT